MKKKGQVILETALSLVAIVIFLVGIIRVWAWFTNQFGDRWSSYNTGRVRAGQVGTYATGGIVPADGYSSLPLNLF